MPTQADFDALASLFVMRAKKVRSEQSEISKQRSQVNELAFIQHLQLTGIGIPVDAGELEQRQRELAARSAQLEQLLSHMISVRSRRLMEEWRAETR